VSNLASARITAAAARADDDIAAPEASAATWRQTIDFLRSPSFRVLTRAALLALGKIVAERVAGRFAITHCDFQSFGLNRGSIVHAVVELEALGIIAVKRTSAHANSFDMSQKWRNIVTLEQAKRIRDRGRHFGIIRRRKVERETARLERAQRLARLKAMLGTPQAPAIADLDDAALAVLDVILDAIGRSRDVAGAALSYEQITGQIDIGRNRLAAALRTLAECGLITITRGRRRRNVYRLAPPAGARHRPPPLTAQPPE
jgi:hypothetical protein